MMTETHDTDAEAQSENTSTPDITRRQVLHGAAAVGALGTFAGVGSAQEGSGTSESSDTREYNVGLEAGASYEVATSRAISVSQKYDFGSTGKVVSGVFSKQAIEDLRQHEAVRYAQPNNPVVGF